MPELQPQNPYLAPAPDSSDPVGSPEMCGWDERTLSRTRKAEEDLKQSTLCLVGVFAVVSVAAIFGMQRMQDLWVLDSLLALWATTAAIVGIVVNRGVRRYAPWSRMPLTLLCCAALPLIPIGTAFGVHILLLLYGRRRQRPRMLSPEHQRLLASADRVTQRTSALTWIGLVLIAILVVSIVVISRLPPEFRTPP